LANIDEEERGPVRLGPVDLGGEFGEFREFVHLRHE
jgi:hypothetical protein